MQNHNLPSPGLFQPEPSRFTPRDINEYKALIWKLVEHGLNTDHTDHQPPAHELPVPCDEFAIGFRNSGVSLEKWFLNCTIQYEYKFTMQFCTLFKQTDDVVALMNRSQFGYLFTSNIWGATLQKKKVHKYLKFYALTTTRFETRPTLEEEIAMENEIFKSSSSQVLMATKMNNRPIYCALLYSLHNRFPSYRILSVLQCAQIKHEYGDQALIHLNDFEEEYEPESRSQFSILAKYRFWRKCEKLDQHNARMEDDMNYPDQIYKRQMMNFEYLSTQSVNHIIESSEFFYLYENPNVDRSHLFNKFQEAGLKIITLSDRTTRDIGHIINGEWQRILSSQSRRQILPNCVNPQLLFGAKLGALSMMSLIATMLRETVPFYYWKFLLYVEEKFHNFLTPKEKYQLQKCVAQTESLRRLSVMVADNQMVAAQANLGEEDVADSPVQCQVCMDRPKNRVFDCGHCVCSNCAGALKLHQPCPFCRMPINSIKPIYL